MGFFDRWRRPAPPADDWSAFAGQEHMFFGLTAPYALIRDEVETGLRGQVPDTVVTAIGTRGKARFLTLGRDIGDAKMIVTFFGFAVRATIEATTRGVTHRVDATITLVFGRVDERGHETQRSWIDLGRDADTADNDDTLQARFLAFRAEHP